MAALLKGFVIQVTFHHQDWTISKSLAQKMEPGVGNIFMMGASVSLANNEL